MGVINWGKDKLRAAKKYFGYGYETSPKHKFTPVTVVPPDRERRSEVRKQYRARRRGLMNVRGRPVLSGERLRKTLAACNPLCLTVQPQYRRKS